MGSQGRAVGEAIAHASGSRAGRTQGRAVGEAFAKAGVGNKRVSELAVLSADQWVPDIRVSDLAILTLGAIPAHYIFTSGVYALSLTQVAAKQELVTQLAALASIQGTVVEQVTQLATLSLVRSDPGKRQLRCFTFDMDGHTFYVLHLGDTGTVVYDQTTKKWSEWKSYLYNNWKANYGINWQAGIIAGSIDSNMVYNVDPGYMFDERALPIISIVTAGYPTRMRKSIACDEIMVTSSVGYVPGTVNATLQLKGSDDFGLTFRDYGTLDMSTATPQTEVSWRSLGQINAPGRIFQLIDAGGAAQRINSIEMFSRDIPDA